MTSRKIWLVFAVSLFATLCFAPTVAAVDVSVSQRDADADFVFGAYDNLRDYFYKPSEVHHAAMLNAALAGLTAELANRNIEYNPQEISSDATWDDARLHFTEEITKAKNLISQIPNLHPRHLAFVATRGMLASLDDSHTFFVSPPPIKTLLDLLIGNYADIGVELEKADSDFYYVSEIIIGGPADKAGLKKFDRVTAIDDKPVSGEIPEIIVKMFGKPGSIVEVTVERNGVAIDFEIIRDLTMEESVSGSIFEENGHVYNHTVLRRFDRNAASYFYQAVKAGEDAGAEAIILDLRGNPGGYIYIMETILGYLLPPDTALLISNGREGRKIYKARGSGNIKAPLAVLINKTSYSCSEMTTAALQESKRAVIVGTKSGGKAGIGQPLQLAYYAFMSVTIAEVFTPSGKAMEKTGVDPDVTVELNLEDIIKGKDSQLKAAIDELMKMIER